MEEQNQHTIKCSGCGATLEFKPGTTSLVCPYCGATQEIETDEEKLKEAHEEHDINIGFSLTEEEIPEVKKIEHKCPSCGAILEIEDDTISTVCEYCQAPIIMPAEKINRKIHPQAVIPFAIDKKQAREIFLQWAKKRFFAPSNFKKYVRTPQKLKGTYVPYWTFDAATYTTYTGERGDDYTVEDTYTDSDGNEVTTTRVETRWTHVSGSVTVDFDDIQLPARRDINRIEHAPQWNTKDLMHYEPKVISGFESKAYTVPIKKAFGQAQNIMEEKIQYAIRRDIGGDHQRIHTYDITYNDVTYKHLLVPVWSFSYQYNNKKYDVIINGQTGEIEGKFPISWFKIMMLILLIVAIIGLLMFLSQNSSTASLFEPAKTYMETQFATLTNPISELLVTG